MTSPDKAPAMSSSQRAELLAATGRTDLGDALQWIAEGRPMSAAADTVSILVALVSAAEAKVAGADQALRAAVRSALHSNVDTSTDLVLTSTIVPPDRYQTTLAGVARRTASGTLVDVTNAAVFAAQADDPMVIETLALVAGLSWRDLQARVEASGGTVPGDPHGAWRAHQIADAFKIIDAVVRDRVATHLDGSVAARPVELLLDGRSGWDQIEELRSGGVSYGTLLAQREVGGAWSAHRNRTNNEISRLMVRRVLSALDDASVGYWSTEGDTAVTRAAVGERAGVSGRAPGQLCVVTRRADGAAGFAVLIAIARDGGTARKTAATLSQLPQRLQVPAALVLFGTGWADRGESDDLARAYSGRLYTEHTLTNLARLAASVSTT